MPNGTDTDTEDVDVEGPPEADIDTSDQSPLAGLATPATTGPATPAPPSARNQPMELPEDLAGSLLGGLSGNTQPVGQQVQQRHGGLLTGLAGVLLDGLASGMAPTAAMASQMPMIRQQQAMQQQQLQLQQQKMQEEMKLAPVREKLLLAQAQMQFMQLDHAMMEMTTQNQAGLTDFYRDFVGKKIASNAAEEVATGSLDDAKAYQREHAHDPDGMQLFLWPKERDAQGNITKASVVKILPDAWSPAVKYEHDYTSPITGKKYAIKVDSPAGPAALQNVDVGKQLTTQYADVGADDQAAKNPQQGLMRAINQAQQAGKSGQAVFDDPNVKTAIQAIQATQKPGGGFESEAYGQYAQGEQAKGRQPLSMRDFHARLWPQTQIAFAGLGIRQAGEARQEAASEYQATDRTGRRVAGSMAELQAAGFPISRITKQTAVQQQQTDAGRDLISPDGLFAIARRQMTDLEAKGKLGPVASRWNNFWARQGLDGDQQAFRNTLDLLGSRLMAAHLQRTNVSALEHFSKMIPENSTPAALKTELNEEYKYVLGQAKILGAPAAQ